MLLRIQEYESIDRRTLQPAALRRLERFDTVRAAAGQTIFDWSRAGSITAKNYVGVIQVPGLTIEILPKVTGESIDSSSGRAQGNLIYMLSVAGLLPFEERDFANQWLRRLPLADVLVAAFARAALRELRRGVPHAYVEREENLRFLRGKVLYGANARLNATHRERLFVRFDEFSTDIPINQIILAATNLLSRRAMSRRTSSILSQIISVLRDVPEVAVTPTLFDRLHLDRNTRRFEAVLEFCRAVLLDQVPTPASGEAPSFSLLFPMQKVFERFVAGLMCRNTGKLGLAQRQIHVQASGRSRWLVSNSEGAGCFRLRPDVLIEDADFRQIRCVLDTKWKRPGVDADDRMNSVLPADMYQLYAYAHRFESPDNILLYPFVPGAMPKEYFLREYASERRIRVEFLNLSRELYEERRALIADLAVLLRFIGTVSACNRPNCPV